MRRRTTWTPAPAPTPGQVLPALIFLSVVTAALAVCAAALIWSMILNG